MGHLGAGQGIPVLFVFDIGAMQNPINILCLVKLNALKSSAASSPSASACDF